MQKMRLWEKPGRGELLNRHALPELLQENAVVLMGKRFGGRDLVRLLVRRGLLLPTAGERFVDLKKAQWLPNK